MSKRICGLLCKVGAAIITGALTVALPCAAQQLTNDKLSLTVDAQAGSYQLRVRGGQPIFTSRVAAQVDHQWLRSSEYPDHQASESPFTDELGSGRTVTVTCTGLEGKADLVYVVQLYDQRPYATLRVTVRNPTLLEYRRLTADTLLSAPPLQKELSCSTFRSLALSTSVKTENVWMMENF